VDRYADAPEVMVPPDSVQPAAPIAITNGLCPHGINQGEVRCPDCEPYQEPEGVWDDPEIAAPGPEKESLL
jgi:hypothetical protein